MKYPWYDESVKNAVNQAHIGNADLIEIQFNEPEETFDIHKDDVIHLAKCFGLAVYERESEL